MVDGLRNRLTVGGIALAWMLATLLMARPGAAEEGVTLIGPGARTCAQFNADYEIDGEYAENTYFSWAQGYLTGINSRSDRFYHLLPDALPRDQQRRFLRQYCNRKPKIDFIEAVRALYQRIVTENIAEGR